MILWGSPYKDYHSTQASVFLQDSGNEIIQSCAAILNVSIILASVPHTRNTSWRVIH